MPSFKKLMIGSLAAAALAAALPVLADAPAPSKDPRKTIELTKSERDMILAEMRKQLFVIQRVLDAAIANEMPRVAENARIAGIKNHPALPAALYTKFPPKYRDNGFALAENFDDIARDAEKLKDRELTLSQVNGIMRRCVQCHSEFNFLTVGN